ncbi:hypothetical protein FGO68_gene17427 [Halteria grandinella]|uniref:NAD(P)(+)--arginine ADP-ribosyltransferase n=1 Tax=Halteria grandinella TaxID=5974 RepID=A0A8J8P2I8_HALGN|nr:hypothetical protein FGO68_gene17427 [Halteria grandinella]
MITQHPSTLLFIHKQMLLKDSDFLPIGEQLEAQVKLNPGLTVDYVINDKQMLLDVMFSLREEVKVAEIVEELRLLSKSKERFKEVEALYTDQHLLGDDDSMLKSLIKTYTSECCYKDISLSIVNGLHEKAQNYLSCLLREVREKNKHVYQSENPLYRGVLKEYIKLEDYREGRVHYWPALSSTSKKKKVAIKIARRGKPDNAEAVIFKVYTLSSLNSPPTNVDLPPTWSFYPSEEEVLLLPFFCFQVISITQKSEKNLTIVSLVEIPHQNWLQSKDISMSRVIWVDGNIHSAKNQKYRMALEDEFAHIGFAYASSLDEGVSLLNSTVKAVLLVSGSLGQLLLPRIHHLNNLMGAVIFCMDVDTHDKWARGYKKVRAITNRFKDAMEVAKCVLNEALQMK